jgi:hypothetical protein
MRMSRWGILCGATLAFAMTVFCVPAQASLVTSWSERQVVPGLTERTIWSQAQVAVYRLPQNVTHTGDLHIELTYKPVDDACLVFLLDENGAVCAGTGLQGREDLRPGTKVVDFDVPAVVHPEPNPETGEIVGDAYYVLVQALNGAHSYRLSGYLPRAAAGSLDTTSPDTLARATLRIPAGARAWNKIGGAPYGGPWDFTPTSQGTVSCRLQYPADAKARSLTPPSPAMPASFEQYVYPADWDADAALPLSQPTELSHWDLWGHPHAGAPVWSSDWYGVDGGFLVDRAGAWRPGLPYHYDPALWMVSSVPALGPASPPATGVRTVGYKATLLIPQDLRLASATKKVRRGRRATFKGTLALSASAAPGAAVAWAPAGTKLKLQRRVSGGWVDARTVTVGASGAWKTTAKPNKTAVWRAWWPGEGALAPEPSPTRRVTVVRR